VMFYALPLGIALGWLRGGSLDRLGAYPFRCPALLAGAFAIQLFLVRSGDLGLAISRNLVFPLHLFSYALLISVLLVNLHAPGIPVVLLGALGNSAVIALNGGMPVDVIRLENLGYAASAAALRAGEIATHRALTESTRLPFLGDVLLGPRWIPGAALLSVGDLAMMVGIAWVISAGMTYDDLR